MARRAAFTRGDFMDTDLGRRVARHGTPGNELTPAQPAAGAGMTWDPETQRFIDVAKGQMARLSQPFSDPGLDEVVRMIRSQAGSLSAAPPVAFSVSNPLLGDFVTQGRQRMAELNQEPFTAAEEARMRTRALESVEKDRSASRERALENISRRGIADTSGILLEMEDKIDRGADANRTNAETDLAMFTTQERNRRRDAATTIAAQLASAGAQEAGLGLQAQIASHSANQSRSAQIMSAAGMLAELAAQRRGEDRARQNDVLAIAQTLANLAPQRMAQLMTVLHGTGGNDASGLFTNTLNLNNSVQARRDRRDASQDAALMSFAEFLGYAADPERNRRRS